MSVRYHKFYEASLTIGKAAATEAVGLIGYDRWWCWVIISNQVYIVIPHL